MSTRRAPGTVALPALLLALAGLPAAAPAQAAGSAASTLLRLAPGPRILSLGDAGVAAEDAWAVEYNPAGAGAGAPARGGDGSSVAAAYQALPLDVRAGAAVFGARLGPGGLGVSLRFVDYGSIDVVEQDGDLPVGVPTGATATGGELSALLAYAVAVGPLRVGVAGRWLRLDVAGLTDAAVSADAGVHLRVAEWLTLGGSVQALGEELHAGRGAPLPRTWRGGAALTRGWSGGALLLIGEARHREDRTGFAGGLEVRGGGPTLRARGRLGYEVRPDPGDAFSPLVVGGGVSLDRLTLDFAYRALGPLGSTRQLGITYGF